MTERIIFESKLNTHLVQLKLSKKYLHLVINNGEKDFILKYPIKKSDQLEYDSNNVNISFKFKKLPFKKQREMKLILNDKLINTYQITEDYTIIDSSSTQKQKGVFIKS